MALSGPQHASESFLPTSFIKLKLPHSGFSAVAGKVYPLRDSFSLDSGPMTHICNCLSCFQSLRKCDPNDVVYASSEKMPVVSVGLVDITYNTGTKSRSFWLNNVAFILFITINVVSLSKFPTPVVNWNTAVDQLVFNRHPFCYVSSNFS